VKYFNQKLNDALNHFEVDGNIINTIISPQQHNRKENDKHFYKQEISMYNSDDYFVYTKEYSKKIKDNLNNKPDIEDDNDDENDSKVNESGTADLDDTEVKENTLNKFSETVSSLSSGDGTRKLNIKINSREVTILDKYTRNFTKIKNVCNFIVIINTISVITGIIFLFIIKANLDEISLTFSAVQSYKSAMVSLCLHQIMTVTLTTLKDANGKFSPNDFEYNFMNPTVDNNFKIDFAKYTSEDYRILLSQLIDKVNKAKIKIHQTFPKDLVESQIDIPCEYFELSDTNEKGYEVLNKTLFELMEYYCFLVLPFANNDDNFIGIDPITLANNSSYIHMINKYLVTEGSSAVVERNFIIMMINFFKNINKNADNVFDTLVDYEYVLVLKLKNLINYAFGTLVGIEFIIFALAFWIVNIYKNQTQIMLKIIYQSSKELLARLMRKIVNVKHFLNFTENPIKVLKNLERDEKKKEERENLENGIIGKMSKLSGNDAFKNKNEKKEEEEESNKIIKLFVKDDSFISTYFHKVICLLISVILIYFSISILMTNTMSDQVVTNIRILNYFFENMKFGINSISFLSTAVILNKTNLEDDYFDQKIRESDYNEMSKDFYDKFFKIQPYLRDDSTYPLLYNFLDTLKGDNMCKFIVEIIDTSLTTENKHSFTKQDIEDTFTYLCYTLPTMQTDLFSLLSNFNLRMRRRFNVFINADKTVANLKKITDSKEFYFLQVLGSNFLSQIMAYVNPNVVSPTINNSLNALFKICIIILVINVAINIVFLVVTKKFFLDLLICNMNYMNILLGVLH
jgi:hypothetical protein